MSIKEKREMLDRMDNDDELRREFFALQNLNALTTLIPNNGEDTTKATKVHLLKFKRKVRIKLIVKSLHAVSRYAAIALIAVIATMFISLRSKSNTVTIRYEEFSIPAGQHATVTLHDGTRVWLNARSTLRYPNVFTDTREVELTGEAFFDVAEKKDKPFTVNVAGMKVSATGTQFNVFAYGDNSNFTASLIEGTIEVSDKAGTQKPIELKKDEYAAWRNGKLIRDSLINKDFLLWKEGIYAFDDVPFSDIVSKLELYYDVKIIVRNDNLGKYRFTGKFRQRDGITSVLRAMQIVNRFNFIKDDETNIIIIQ